MLIICKSLYVLSHPTPYYIYINAIFAPHSKQLNASDSTQCYGNPASGLDKCPRLKDFENLNSCFILNLGVGLFCRLLASACGPPK